MLDQIVAGWNHYLIASNLKEKDSCKPELVAFGLWLVYVIAALFWSSTQRSEDRAQIKKVYTDFRTAYLQKRYDQAATNYLSSDLLGGHPDPNEFFAKLFRVPESLPPLEQDAYVQFNKADQRSAAGHQLSSQ
jgi:hypothetical protein